jgi:hypothetical protein
MRKRFSRLIGRQKGQALVIVLCFLAIGGLTVATLLNYMTTGLKAIQVQEEKMNEFYAADAGVEDAMYQIISDNATLQELDEGGTNSYTLNEPINNIMPVSVNITKVCLLDGILNPGDYQLDKPHEGWFSFSAPTIIEETEEYVDYYCNINLHNTGGAPRQIRTMGVFFAPSPGDTDLIMDPFDIVYTANITSDHLEVSSPETFITNEGFSFVWEWETSPDRGPVLGDGDTGALSFTLRVYQPEWEYSVFFAFATTKEQDISFITSNPSPYKWLIKATAAGTEIRSSVIETVIGLAITSWEIR